MNTKDNYEMNHTRHRRYFDHLRPWCVLNAFRRLAKVRYPTITKAPGDTYAGFVKRFLTALRPRQSSINHNRVPAMTKTSITQIGFISTMTLLIQVGQAQVTPASFTLLGDLQGGLDESLGHGISADGNLLVGRSRSGFADPNHEAFAWVEGQDIEGLGDFPNPVSTQSFAKDCTDGGFVVGFGQSHSGPEAFLVQLNLADLTQNNIGIRLGDLAGGSFWSIAEAISPEGKYIVGRSKSGQGPIEEAWVITVDVPNQQPGSMTALGDLDGGTFRSAAYGVADGGGAGPIIVGYGITQRGREAVRWQGQDKRSMGTLDTTAVGSWARDISFDGIWAVGDSFTSSLGDVQAFIWEDTGVIHPDQTRGTMTALPNISGTIRSVANAISGDGNTVVGTYFTGTGVFQEHAFIWRKGDPEMLDLRDYLATFIGTAGDLGAWHLKRGEDVNGDGTVFVGTAVHLVTQELQAFRVVLPSAEDCEEGAGHNLIITGLNANLTAIEAAQTGISQVQTSVDLINSAIGDLATDANLALLNTEVSQIARLGEPNQCGYRGSRYGRRSKPAQH